MNSRSDHAMERRAFQVSCERCRKRKIKCDRLQPCTKCEKAGVECTFIGSGEKQRPVSRGYVQALEGQIASLEKFITKLIAVNGPQRDEMLANFGKSSGHFHPPVQDFGTGATSPDVDAKAISIRSTTGHLRRMRDGKAAEFYGPTSFFQISPSDTLDEATSATEALSIDPPPSLEIGGQENEIPNSLEESSIDLDAQLAFSPQSHICRTLMASFFQNQYQYHMCLYREYFLRDFDAGEGPYYSDLLMYAICAMGALASEEIALRELSDVFFNRAQQLLYGSALESPNLTTLQALILLGHREIGHGKMSKGWLFSGMAFRLAHEMGLHLDPSNWKSSDDSRVEREILRRTYWAAFIADKHLSLYFGRPPALYPRQSDVNDTIRIPYPPEWESLLNTYIMQGTSETAYEDGLTLVASFVQQAELCKILHRMIIEVFENRGANTDETVLATSVKDIDVALTKWSANLPAKLHWNQWSVGPIPSLVVYLHMMYHTALIILHRPPRNLFRDPTIATSEDVKTCYESLGAIFKLVGIYSRQHQFSHLPLTFVHILASAASIVLMKRHIERASWATPEVSKSLGVILDALDAISQTWPCAKQVRAVINSAMKESTPEAGGSFRNKSPEGFDLMTGLARLPDAGNDDFLNGEFGFNMDDADIGFYLNEDYLTGPFEGEGEGWSFDAFT